MKKTYFRSAIILAVFACALSLLVAPLSGYAQDDTSQTPSDWFSGTDVTPTTDTTPNYNVTPNTTAPAATTNTTPDYTTGVIQSGPSMCGGVQMPANDNNYIYSCQNGSIVATPTAQVNSASNTCGGVAVPTSNASYSYSCVDGSIVATPATSVSSSCPPGDYDPSCYPGTSYSGSSPTSLSSQSSAPVTGLASQSSAPVTGPGSQSTASTQTTNTLQNPLNGAGINSVGGLVQSFVTVASYILVLFGILALMWTGLQYVLARGNAEEIKKLHTTLLFIVIGIAIVIGARVIVQVVLNTLQATGTVSTQTINSAQNALNGQ